MGVGKRARRRVRTPDEYKPEDYKMALVFGSMDYNRWLKRRVRSKYSPDVERGKGKR